jgi:hypothetical protein
MVGREENQEENKLTSERRRQVHTLKVARPPCTSVAERSSAAAPLCKCCSWLLQAAALAHKVVGSIQTGTQEL